uniref:DNA/RNA-binding protein Alba-like domain-containing protein n=1 Tax=Alexandrium catenella TaxID=2925 RepID=A0A6T9GMA5_ALECA|mmetsp:Transcript_23418/g.63694  ORF Transcript_23418/g.63694 Transcript_23418/m.63694 type:complete len:110 (+) Transcript_23418:77-406(+)
MSTMEMKVSMKKGIGFYIRAAASFLKGVEAKEAVEASEGKEGKEAMEAKAPVDELKISGLGEAINTAVTAATRAEADGLGTITKVETAYPDMSNGRGCAQIFITLKRKA